MNISSTNTIFHKTSHSFYKQVQGYTFSYEEKRLYTEITQYPSVFVKSNDLITSVKCPEYSETEK